MQGVCVDLWVSLSLREALVRATHPFARQGPSWCWLDLYTCSIFFLFWRYLDLGEETLLTSRAVGSGSIHTARRYGLLDTYFFDNQYTNMSDNEPKPADEVMAAGEEETNEEVCTPFPSTKTEKDKC